MSQRFQHEYKKITNSFHQFQVGIAEPKWSKIELSPMENQKSLGEKKVHTATEPELKPNNYTLKHMLKHTTLKKLLKQARKFEAILKLAMKIVGERHTHIRLH